MAKHKYIENPQKMWELFESYKKDVKDNPRTMSEFHGKDGEERIKPLERPLTMAGFEIYVMNDEGVESKGVEQYFSNLNDCYTEFLGICSHIRKEIRNDQIEGGMVGQYNSSITQRLNGLTDKTEVKTEGKVKISFK
tara:strand:- start:65 stop:475 length:411 start_codon:yes stop_codon:yes gene_type:complete